MARTGAVSGGLPSLIFHDSRILARGGGGTSLTNSIWTQAFLVTSDKSLRLIFKKLTVQMQVGLAAELRASEWS